MWPTQRDEFVQISVLWRTVVRDEILFLKQYAKVIYFYFLSYFTLSTKYIERNFAWILLLLAAAKISIFVNSLCVYLETIDQSVMSNCIFRRYDLLCYWNVDTNFKLHTECWIDLSFSHILLSFLFHSLRTNEKCWFLLYVICNVANLSDLEKKSLDLLRFWKTNRDKSASISI